MSVPGKGGRGVSGSEGLGTQGPTVNTQALWQLWIFPQFVDLFTESVSPFSVAMVCQIPGVRNDQEQRDLRSHGARSLARRQEPARWFSCGVCTSAGWPWLGRADTSLLLICSQAFSLKQGHHLGVPALLTHSHSTHFGDHTPTPG